MDIRKFFIKPSIPEELAPLQEIALNTWSCWDSDAKRLFHRIEPNLFIEVKHNPIELLYKIKSERLNELAQDKGFLNELRKIHEKFNDYMNYRGTYVIGDKTYNFSDEDIIAYTCMEYGIHESIPLYSGGLAVLAGDQLKAVSDVGFSMVSFGLLYNYGYFKQRFTQEGDQIEEFNENTWYLSAVKEVLNRDGMPIIIEIPFKDHVVHAKLWKIQVGRVPLFLISTNVHQNPQEYRNITNKLYDADPHMRLKQELILGKGSVIALKALNIQPKVFHINEGHTAFSIVERLKDLIINKKLSLEDAIAIIRHSTVFTTHTPVIEGNEHFDDDLIKEYLEEDVKQLGMTMDQFLAFGKMKKSKTFWLPVYAMKHARCINSVSKIHATVSQNMWRDLFPSLHEKELPIEAITNGVHLQSWLSFQMTELFDRYIGPDYFQKMHQSEIWDNIYKIPDVEIWNAHRRRKEQVISFIRKRISDMMKHRGYCKNRIFDVEEVLGPDCLTIGFARRFAPYKRANLILQDKERLYKLITDPNKPIQLVFSGKAHPADGLGKELIKQIFQFISDYSLEKSVVFLEDYDINIARHLVQGVDVWLNTPIKPMEASGTSGMKAAINGVLNLSILDGWWPEAYNGKNGWAIQSGVTSDDPDARRINESNHLYELLENDVTDIFYTQTDNDLPLEWIQMMKNAMVTVCSQFNMNRTVREYFTKFYIPQIERYNHITESENKRLKKLRQYKKKIHDIWTKIYIRDYFTSVDGKMPVSGEEVTVDCYVHLGDVDHQLIKAEIFYSNGNQPHEYKIIPLSFIEKYEDKVAKYSGNITLQGSGLQEISTRLVPADEDFREIHPEYIKWKD